MLADTDLLFKQAREGSAAFQQALPYPHLLIPGMLKTSCRVAVYEGLCQWACADHSREAFYPQQGLPSVLHLLMWELSSSTLIRHFAALAGTPPLLPDPWLSQGGFFCWQEPSVLHSAEGEYQARHPRNDLLNTLRLEIFVAQDPRATFSIELLDDNRQVLNTLQVSSGSLIMTWSNRYCMRYADVVPGQWASLLSHYYVNDRARVLNGEEQPSAY